MSGTTWLGELFLRMMEGWGFTGSDSDEVELLPAAKRYRTFLDEMSGLDQWVIGAAVLTIFVEGSVNERRELENTSPESDAAIQAAIPPQSLGPVPGGRAQLLPIPPGHQKVESRHRPGGSEKVLDHQP